MGLQCTHFIFIDFHKQLQDMARGLLLRDDLCGHACTRALQLYGFNHGTGTRYSVVWCIMRLQY